MNDLYGSKAFAYFDLCQGSCHLDRASNVKISVECQIFVTVTFLFRAKFYNLGHIQGIIRLC